MQCSIALLLANSRQGRRPLPADAQLGPRQRRPASLGGPCARRAAVQPGAAPSPGACSAPRLGNQALSRNDLMSLVCVINQLATL